jgi:hypothetical protein
MRPALLDLLRQDIYTDTREHTGRVTQAREIVRDIESRLASGALIEKARDLYQTDDVEVDDSGVETSRALDGFGDGENGEPIGTWVQAWVWVPDNEPE